MNAPKLNPLNIPDFDEVDSKQLRIIGLILASVIAELADGKIACNCNRPDCKVEPWRKMIAGIATIMAVDVREGDFQKRLFRFVKALCAEAEVKANEQLKEAFERGFKPPPGFEDLFRDIGGEL